MIMQDFKHLQPPVPREGTLAYSIERLRIACRRFSVAVLRELGVKSERKRIAETRKSIRRDNDSRMLRFLFDQGLFGLEGRWIK